jgi:PAS domain S-box-containing protein
MSLSDEAGRVLHVGGDASEPLGARGAENVLSVEDVDGALEAIAEGSVDCVIVDDGVAAVARHVRERHPGIPLVVRTDAGPVAIADGKLPPPDVADSESALERCVDAADGTTSDPRAVLEALGDGVVALDTDRRILAVNGALAELTGYARGELLGQPVSILLDGAIDDAAADRLAAVERGERDVDGRFEVELCRADGERVPVEVDLSPVESDGTPTGVAGVIRDVTERRERRRERELWRAMVDAVTDGLYALDGDRNVIAASEGFARLAGRDLDSLIGEHVSVCVEESTIAENVEVRRDIMEGERAYGEWEFDVVRPDGERVPVENRYTGLPTEEGLYGTAGVMRDIRDRRERERELELRRAMVDAVTDGLYALDAGRNVLAVNEAFAEMVGRDVESLVGEHVSVCVDDSLLKETDDEREAVLAGDLPDGRHEFDLITPDGDRTPIELRYAALPDSDSGTEGLRGTTGVMRDITDRRERERELRLKDRVLEAADLSVTIADVTREGDPFVYVNRGFERLTGYDRERALGEGWRLLYGPETDPGAIETVRRAVAARESASVELLNYRADGTPFWNQLTLTPVADDSGSVTHFIGFQQDVTERRRRERALANLHDWTRRMIRAEGAEEVVEAAAGAIDALFDEPNTGVYTLDGERGHLALVGDERDGSLPATLADGPVWEAFVSGTVSVRSAGDDGGTDPLGAGLVHPLGTHGVVVVGWGREEPVPRDTADLMGLLAANVETALDRAAVESALRDRERRLTARNEELARLDRTNAVIRGVHRALVSAGSREAGRAAVADWLAEADPYELAWFARVRPDGDVPVEPVVGGGDVGEAYLDVLRDRLPGSPLGALVAEAAATREVRIQADVLDAPDWQSLRPDALAHGYRSVAAIPVTVSGRLDGVLVVHGTDAGTFPPADAEVLSELGGLIGRTLRTVHRAGVGSPDHPTALELEIPGPQLAFSRAAADVGAPLTQEGSVPTGDGSVISYLSSPVDGETLVEAIRTREGISDVALITEDDDGALVELRKAHCRITTIAGDAGGRLRSVVAAADHATVTIDIPANAEVRTVVEAVDAVYPGTTLQARRERVSPDLPRTVSAALRERCTDRQYEALTGAYYSGYYDWPRLTTAADLADRAGVSSPTFQYHLRTGERKLLDVVLG